jgi:hypothetical protein
MSCSEHDKKDKGFPEFFFFSLFFPFFFFEHKDCDHELSFFLSFFLFLFDLVVGFALHFFSLLHVGSVQSIVTQALLCELHVSGLFFLVH